MEYINSQFDRNFKSIDVLHDAITQNNLLRILRNDYLSKGEAFLAFRNGEATIYIKGRQIVSIKDTDCEPSIVARILPIARSQYPERDKKLKEDEWINFIGSKFSFSDLLTEIVDFAEKDADPESEQVSALYKYSAFSSSGRWILLDIEAYFKKSRKEFKGGEHPDNDRIDAVLYDTEDRQLLFVEVKRNCDKRLRNGEIQSQLKRYKTVTSREKDRIENSYNKVIGLYNNLCDSDRLKPIDPSKDILLLLVITEFSREDYKPNKHPEELKDAGIKYISGLEKELAKNDYPVESLGSFSSASQKTFTNKWKKTAERHRMKPSKRYEIPN